MRIYFQIVRSDRDGTGRFSDMVLEEFNSYEEAEKKIASYYIYTSNNEFYIKKAFRSS